MIFYLQLLFILCIQILWTLDISNKLSYQSRGQFYVEYPYEMAEQDIKNQTTNRLGFQMEEDDVETILEVSKDDKEARSCLMAPGAMVYQGPVCMGAVQTCVVSATAYIKRNHTVLLRGFYTLLVLLYLAYLGWALYTDAVRARPLLALSVLILVCIVWYNVGDAVCHQVQKAGDYITGTCGKTGVRTKRLLVVLVLISIALFMGFYIKPQPRQLVSLVGVMVFLLFLFIFSTHPFQVRLGTVCWGLLLQFLLGVILLRTSWGIAAARAASGQVQKFISFSDQGASVVFGDSYEQHRFAFKILPVVIFFSATVSILYHVGVMQVVIRKVAWCMRVTMGTSASESVCAAGNIFVGMTEAPILVQPFINDMTLSELHAMMTAGFATIAGSVLAVYIMIGVSAQHLMSACVMNAPMALTAAKLFYPETQESKTLGKDIEMGESSCRNILDAAATGASLAVKLVGNIAANLIAFIGLLAFANSAFSWFGSMVDHPELTFQMALSYVYLPVVVVMGVEWADAQKVSELLGMKTFINEFVAYEHLATLIGNRQQCLSPRISMRSEVISTYALCGFANLSAIGIQLGTLRALAPSRAADMTKVALRALVAGTVTCFITACIAGLLTIDDDTSGCSFLNGTWTNTTTIPPISYNVSLNSHLHLNITEP